MQVSPESQPHPGIKIRLKVRRKSHSFYRVKSRSQNRGKCLAIQTKYRILALPGTYIRIHMYRDRYPIPQHPNSPSTLFKAHSKTLVIPSSNSHSHLTMPGGFPNFRNTPGQDQLSYVRQAREKESIENASIDSRQSTLYCAPHEQKSGLKKLLQSAKTGA
ncbi:hypothetical protein P175DRAFT_0248243 [Aspergillus ochraceoroseus IBT 24754]|uniref:Uncharacterized protein n=1 Tax=Aspergillus ochraceoroseus IBT 24754 TaxID=1392256 RepID=A0A2T5LY09_9EURO|nr:uncharacterized protein P175DRAFT_0248243 [Aspergillus ochraceoroseus IBT 24754]PTU21171.1 hypothetical protein P175DRAFT_0248243 [Aspergillus ochraceoroseus IBT 24754]